MQARTRTFIRTAGILAASGMLAGCASSRNPEAAVPFTDADLEAIYTRQYDPVRLGLTVTASGGAYEFVGANRVRPRSGDVLEYKMTDDHPVPIIRIRGRDRKTIKALIDTSSSRSFIGFKGFQAFAMVPLAPPIYGIRPTHVLTPHTYFSATPMRIYIGNCLVENPVLFTQAANGSLEGVSRGFAEEGVEAVLGMDMLKSFAYVRFDFKNMELVFSGTDPYRPNPSLLADSVPMKFRDGGLAVEALFNERKLEAVLDTAGRFEVALPEPSRPVVNQVSIGAVNFRTLVRVSTEEEKIDARERFGIDALKAYIVTLDFQRGRVHFESHPADE